MTPSRVGGRVLAFGVACAMLGTPAHGQDSKRVARVQPRDSYHVSEVRAAIESRALGFYAGASSKLIPRLGDRAAVSLMKLYGATGFDEVRILEATSLLNEAFSAPALIEDEADRTPEASIVLLAYLRSRAQSGAARTAIDATATYLTSLPAAPP